MGVVRSLVWTTEIGVSLAWNNLNLNYLYRSNCWGRWSWWAQKGVPCNGDTPHPRSSFAPPSPTCSAREAGVEGAEARDYPIGCSSWAVLWCDYTLCASERENKRNWWVILIIHHLKRTLEWNKNKISIEGECGFSIPLFTCFVASIRVCTALLDCLLARLYSHGALLTEIWRFMS